MPITVVVPNTTIHIEGRTNASFPQKAAISSEHSAVGFTFTGQGEGNRLMQEVLDFSEDLPHNEDIFGPTKTFHVTISTGNGESNCRLGELETIGAPPRRIQQRRVFSEDATDNDQNDCIVTFWWKMDPF